MYNMYHSLKKQQKPCLVRVPMRFKIIFHRKYVQDGRMMKRTDMWTNGGNESFDLSLFAYY